MSTGKTAARGGRPRKDEFNRRALVVKARVRPDELAAIEGRAAAANRTVSDFLREMGLSGHVLVQALSALSDVDRVAIARIGSNLNQIARICNTTGDSARARSIEDLLDELRPLLRRSYELGQG